MRPCTRLLVLILPWLGALPVAAEDLTLSWTAMLEHVQVDNPPSVFNGFPVGTPVGGSITYDDVSCDAGCTGTGSAGFYTFVDHTANMDFGTLSLVYGPPDAEATVVVNDDSSLGSLFADVLSAVTGTTVVPGTLIDAWTLTSREQTLDGDRRFGLAFVSFDTSLYDSSDYRRAPDPADVDVVYFFAIEGTFLNFYFGTGLATLGGAGDLDGDGILDASDNCPHASNPGQANSDALPRGDACLCGDQTGDGRITVSDILGANAAIFDPALAAPLCDANHDGMCNVGDILGINAEIFSPGETAVCAQQPCPDLELSCPAQN